MKQRINIDFLKEDNFDEKFYTRIFLSEGNFSFWRSLDIWDNENDFRNYKDVHLELVRYYTPKFVKWINDSEHK